MTESFDDLNLKDNLLRGIYSYGFENPSPIQGKAIPIMNDKKDRMIWSVHNLDQNIDIINKKNTLEEVDFTIRHEQVMRLEKLLKNANKVKFWLMGKEDAIFSISDQDRLANLEVINYYKKLDLKTS